MGRRVSLELLGIAATVLAATFLVYALTVRLPGDPALALWRAQHGEAAPDPVQLAALREEAGFDDGLLTQYGRWLSGAVRGDMGESYITGKAVFPQLLDRLPTTLVLAFGSLALGFVLALPTAAIASRTPWLKRLMLSATQLGLSLPDYFLGLLLVIVFGLWLNLLPVTGWGSPLAPILPIVTLAAYPWALCTRLLAEGIAEHSGSDWARTGRAKGLSERYLLLRHILPHTLPGVLGLLGILAGGALSSALIVEVIFAIPGAGRLLFDAIGQRDMPMVQAALVVQVAIAVICARLADAATTAVNPLLAEEHR